MNTALLVGMVITYVILTVGTLIQRGRIVKRKSSGDISIWDVSLRLLASVLLLVKFVALEDTSLIWGQGIFVCAYVLNCYAVIKYHGNNGHRSPE